MVKKQENTAVTKPKTQPMALMKEEILGSLETRIRSMQADGDIHFPPNYSPQNALKSAWLILQDAKDKDKNSVLNSCTKQSIYNALFDMLIMGLNPDKKQGYFIAYGKSLVFQRSYFGSMALAKRVDEGIADISAEVVYEDDTFEYEILKGQKVVSVHKQKLGNVNKKKVIGAYAMIIDFNGAVVNCDIMTMDEITQAWKQSAMNPIENNGKIKANSTHDKFTADMCKKTVINRLCKPVFNSSDDKYLKLAAERSSVIRAHNESEEDIHEHANQEIIDIEAEETQEVDTDQEQNEVGEPEPTNLICPPEFFKSRHVIMNVCEDCKYNNDCHVYIEHMISRDSDGEQDQGARKPGF